MSKKNKNKYENRENNGNDKNTNKIEIHEDVIEFGKMTFKKYKKKNGDDYDSKKELKEGYYMYLTERLPEAIKFVVNYGYMNKEGYPETKDAIFTRLTDEGYIKYLKNEISDGNKIKNIKLLPIVIKEIVDVTNKFNTEQLANNPNAEIADISDLIELSQVILKKKMKKLEKEGVDLKLALDVLSVVPNDVVFEKSHYYRVRLLMDTLYEHAKTKAVPYATIMDIVIDESRYSLFTLFSLLERKEKFGTLTDSQKTLYLDITNWVFNTMEHVLSNKVLTEVINKYIDSRRKDESMNKDGNRRYAMSTLSETDYPRITALIKQMVARDSSIQKYL